MNRVDILYPFEFDEVAPVLTRMIQLQGLKHLRGKTMESLRLPSVTSAMYAPQLFGLNSEQQQVIREVLNDRTAEGTEAQKKLFNALYHAGRGNEWRWRMPTTMHSLWVCYWMLANRSQLGQGAFTPFVVTNFTQMNEILFPDFDAALARYITERDAPAAGRRSPLRRLLGPKGEWR